MNKHILSEEFLRMQKLAGIITENNIHEEQEPDFSDLSKIDDLIGDELEKAEEEQPVTEIIGLTTAAFVLAIPGIVNGIAKIIKAIKDKAPPRFNLSKPGDDKSHLAYIIKFTDKIDGYLDGPFKLMLNPFIKDSTKRDKVAKFLKAITLMIMSLGTDITKSSDLMAIGKELTPDWINIVTSPNIATLITNAKTIIPKILT
jgi:hypothetical protein